MQNSHAEGAAYQALDDGALLEEHIDEDKEKVCGGCESVCRDLIQPGR